MIPQSFAGPGDSARGRNAPTQDGQEIASRDRLLVALAFSSGAVDTISFVVLGKVFTAFMTGNLVFLALGLTKAGEQEVGPVLLALASFSAGVMVARRIVGNLSGHEIWPGVVSRVLRLAALAQSGFLLVWIATSGHPMGGEVDVLLGLSAIAMGLQSGAVRALGAPEVFTTAATATVIGLMSDLAARTHSADTVRLAMVLVGLVAGAAASGLFLIHLRVPAAAVPLAMTLLVVALASRRAGRPA